MAETLGKRQNNPGCIRAGSNGYRVYATLEEGYLDLARLLQKGYTNRTAYEIFNKYAPASDGNNPQKYAQTVIAKLREKLGPKGIEITDSTILDVYDPEVLKALMGAISKVECGETLGDTRFVEYAVDMHYDPNKQFYFWTGKAMQENINLTAGEIIKKMGGDEQNYSDAISYLRQRGINDTDKIDLNNTNTLAAMMAAASIAQYGQVLQGEDCAKQAADNFLYARSVSRTLDANAINQSYAYPSVSHQTQNNAGAGRTLSAKLKEADSDLPRIIKPSEFSLAQMYYEELKKRKLMTSYLEKQAKAGVIDTKGLPLDKLPDTDKAYLDAMVKTEKCLLKLKTKKAGIPYQKVQVFLTAAKALETQIKAGGETQAKALKQLKEITSRAIQEIYERKLNRTLTAKEREICEKDAQKLIDSREIQNNPEAFFRKCNKELLTTEEVFKKEGSLTLRLSNSSTPSQNENAPFGLGAVGNIINSIGSIFK